MLDYTELSSRAEEILDISNAEGITLSLAKDLSPRFSRILSLGVLSPAIHGIGFRVLGEPLSPAPDQMDAGELPLSNPPQCHRTVVAATMFQDCSLEAQVDMALSRNWRMGGLWWSSAKKDEAVQFHGHCQYDSRRLGVKALYMTESHLAGLSWLWRLGSAVSPWTAGAEVLMDLTGMAPGASFGCRRAERDMYGRATILTGTVTPISGHVITTYTSEITQELAMSTRFEFNVNSHESNMAVGLAVTPAGGFFRLLGSVDVAKGLGFLLECHLAQIRVTCTASVPFKAPLGRLLGLDITLHFDRATEGLSPPVKSVS